MDYANAVPVKFKRIATAMGFSPKAKANLAEVYRIATKSGAKMLVLHVGQWTERCAITYASFLQDIGISDEDVELHISDGDPREELLNMCMEQQADLLALGALQREGMFKVFNASIARDVCRKAHVSLLLLTHSKVEEQKCERIVVNGLHHPKTPSTIKTALWFGSRLGCNEVVVVDELSEKELIRPEDDKSQLNNTRRRKQIEREQHNRIEQILAVCDLPPNTEIKEQHVFGKKGYTIAHFAKAQKADLLVVNSPDTKLKLMDRIFKHDLEHILSDLPTDLLIVHTTKELQLHASTK